MPKRTLPAAGRGLPHDNPRAALEATVTRLIDLLDRLDGDPDLESALGWTGEFCQTHLAQGDPNAPLDAELDVADSEPSLGATAALNQARWGRCSVLAEVDAELDRADDEPSLGSVGYGLSDRDNDQQFWAQGHPFAALDAEWDDADTEAEPDEDSLAAPVGDGDQERWPQGAPGDLEATGTADDLEMHAGRRSADDRRALYAIERQAQALARRLRRGRFGQDKGRLVADPHGDLYRIARLCD